ncbi:TetR/AcrR family transcriptional regulator [Marinobacter sp. MDS2]|uniref:TetR/AcrR family transcriptional regulator n=1 Tax=Marinobacter sp. MDS2 TaxID=3065961 RepID=UPI00273BA52A|nr:TetR/AcrR family transcriptional regulator [Marinobacter sp. MDS2]MDP4547980.1 TetR/AcrR family transcriptional regulator [Marinobacter sp. MDS2]
MRIDQKAFDKAVRELEKKGEITVSDLAAKLGVSRGWLYDNFPTVRELNQRLTDDEVIEVIETLRAEKPSEQITIGEISARLGIVRQTFSRRFSHLKKYLSPDAEVFSPSSAEERLLVQVKGLEEKVKALQEEHAAALSRKEDEIFSLFMRRDAEDFETMSMQSTIKKFQNQVEEHAEDAKKKTREVIDLRLQLAKVKSQQPQGGCEIISHLKPDYSAISEIEKPSLKDINKFFKAAEKENFEQAEEIIADLRPDYVVLFQPFFSCDYTSIPALPKRGKVVLVESNVPLADERQQFLSNIRSEKIIGVCAQTSLAKTKLFVRGLKVPFGDEFVSRLHANSLVPVLKDGFSAVIVFDPGVL